MQPFFNNPFPLPIPNQTQPSASVPPLSSQVFSTDPISLQPQIGMLHPQNSIPFSSNSGTRMSNQQAMLLISQLMAQQQPGLLNNSVPQLGIPQMGLSNLELVPQNIVNSIPLMINPTNPFQGQGQGQIFATQFGNLAQGQLNPNLGLANLQNQLQNMNGVLPIQLLNPPQVGMFNVPSGSNQVVGPLGSNLFGDPSVVIGRQINQNQLTSGVAGMSFNMFAPNKQKQANSSSCGLQQTMNSQPPALIGQLGKPGKIAQHGASNYNQKKFSGNNFKRDWKNKGSQSGNQRSQFQHRDNRKRNFGSQNEHKGKARHGYDRMRNSSHDHPMKQDGKNKRSTHLTYTEKEVKQWREERRRNFPSKENIEKKKAEKLKQSDVFKREATLRREQLKEIMAKQAELGVEVAEIPSHYLCDSEKPNKGLKFSQRGEKRNGRFASRHRPKEKGLLNVSSVTEREPTLLERLLSADIRRDKRRLLQAFRFMVSNSFFKEWPEKPLKYPLVVTKEEDCKDTEEDGKSSLAETLGHMGKDWEDGHGMGDATHDDDDSNDNVGEDVDCRSDDDDNEKEPVTAVEPRTYFDKGPVEVVARVEEAEEGEIID